MPFFATHHRASPSQRLSGNDTSVFRLLLISSEDGCCALPDIWQLVLVGATTTKHALAASSPEPPLMGITTGLRISSRFCNEHVKAHVTKGLAYSVCADEGHATRSYRIYSCSQLHVYVVPSEALDEFVHACIYACTHAQCLGIDHPFQDADTPIEPAVALIFGLKGGVEQLLAYVILKKGAALQSK